LGTVRTACPFLWKKSYDDIYKLSAEAASDDPRLCEPLFLHAMYSGKLNAWLKQGHREKVSLDTARRTLRYVEPSSV
jgi:hypothetical protein